MDKQKYLKIRKDLTTGIVTEEAFKLFYEYWVIFKKDEYLDITLDKFMDTFQIFLQRNFNSCLETVFDYFDRVYNVYLIKDKNGRILTIC